jgi:hypothetical protein
MNRGVYAHSLQYDMNSNQKKNNTKTNYKTEHQSKDAKFLAWQPTPTGEIVALFNITDREHPSYGSTVTADTLNNLNLQVPSTPPKPPSYPLFKFTKE